MEVYYRGYIAAKKQSYVGTEREGKRNITFELMERKVLEVVTGLGISGEDQEQTNKQVEALRGEKEECEGKLLALEQIIRN